MEHRVPLEKKIQLAQYIREENLGNRMKIRQRERILYGNDTQPPLFDRGRLSDMAPPYGNDSQQMQQEGTVPVFSPSTFRYRMLLAVLLFIGFLLCDTKDGRIGTYTTNEIHNMIVADTFHLYDTESNETMEGLASMFGL